MPSISNSSPAKNRPGQMRLSMVLKFTSFKDTPPQVTNSSLLRLLPVTENSVCVNWRVKAARPALESDDHRASGINALARTIFSQAGREMAKGDIDHVF